MDVALILLTIVLSAVGLPVFCIFGYYRVRRKGYPPPSAALVLLGGGAAGILVAIDGVMRMPIDNDVARFLRIFFWYPLAAFVLVTTLVVCILPRRNPRVFGPRVPRFPFAAAGKLLIAVGWGTVLFAIFEGLSIGDAVKLAIIISTFGLTLVTLGRRLKASVSIERTEQADSRPPVLYLRPFNQEGNAFIYGRRSRYGGYLTGVQRDLTSLGEYSFGGANEFDPDPIVTVRFEEYLRGILTATTGPFVALGNPEDYTPPEGAVRTYASDTDWKDHVERLARKSCCIVAEVASSENLKWEFEYLLQQGLQQKLFVMTRPALVKPVWYLRWLWQRSTTWADFAETLRASGYEVPDDPGLGAILTFDAAGRGVILKTGAQTPEEYIEPICTFLGISAGHSPGSLNPPASPTPETVVPDAATPAPAISKSSIERPGILSRFVSSKVFVPALLMSIVAIAFVVPFVRSQREAQRARALAELAPQLGLTLIEENGAVGDADLAGCDFFSGGKNTAVLYAMQGPISSLRALLFDYRYDWETEDREGGKDTHTAFQTVAAFARASQKLARFRLQDNTFGNRMSLSLGDSKHVEFAGNPEFSKRFILLSNDVDSTLKVFTPSLRGFLMNAYPRLQWQIEGAGSWLVLYRPQHRVNPKECRSFLQETSQFALGFFQNSGGQQPNQ